MNQKDSRLAGDLPMRQEPIYVIKADGSREVFDSTKLEHSLKHTGASTKTVESIISIIRDSLIQDTTTHEIYKKAFEILHSEEKPTALRYSLKRAIMEFGPSGFPFEDFIAEVFRQKGYEAITGQIVRGHCVEHEVDVVAWNDKELIMVEAKFHNELGVRSDLKIALYVKARFEDLATVTFNYGGKDRKLDQGWLVTNTKFTSTAIQYGVCQNLTMIGWNYPSHENLHDMILESKLHPLTCLQSLNGREKKVLLDQGVVLCKTLSEKPELITGLGLSLEEKNKVLEEIKAL